MSKKVITMVPVRMAAARLPNKPLLDVNGKTLIQRIYENIKNSKLESDICIAAGDEAIVKECKKFGANVILTDPNLPSGTDRISQALKILDPNGTKYDIVVNFQGDNINVNPDVNIPLIDMVRKTGCDIGTCGMIFKNQEGIQNPNNIKIAMGLQKGETEGRCLYFSRSVIPYTRDPERNINQDLYHHMGIYVFKAESLQKMVNYSYGILEDREKLEQLRALENGMYIRAKIIEKIKLIEKAPADVNTQEELDEIRKYFF